MVFPCRSRLLALLVTALGATACGPAATPDLVDPSEVSDRALAGLDDYIEQSLEEWELPGLAVAVVKDDEVLYLRGFGVRDLESNEPVDEDTVFAIASNTKPFVGTVLGMLAAEGALDWDDRVAERLPGFQMHDEFATRDMQIEDLLSHNSGLATFAGDLSWIGSRFDSTEVLGRIRHVEPSAGFRERYGYCNLMFMVAGEVIRTTTGEPWDVQVRRRLLDPLGMARTTTSLAALASMDNVARPYMFDENNNVVPTPYLDVDNAGPAAALNSTASDMTRWLRVQLAEGSFEGREVIPPEVVARIRVPQTAIPLRPNDRRFRSRHFLAYGLGWFLFDYEGRLVVTHGGGLPGMTSGVALIPEEELGVVTLSNGETPVPQAVFQRILDAFLGVPATDWSAYYLERHQTDLAEQRREREERAAARGTPVPPALPLSAFAGRYHNPVLGHAEVAEAEGALALRLVDHGGLDCPLAHDTANQFRCTWSNNIFFSSDIPFDITDDRVTTFRFSVRPEFIDTAEYQFTRLPPE